MTIFNLLLLVLVLLFSTESMAASGSTGGGSSRTLLYGYDELLLVLQWPTSFCYTQMGNCDNRYPIPDKFTVHGLWPNQNSKGVCCSRPYPVIRLPAQQSRYLRQYWPNLLDREKPEAFWTHEYGRHGYCFADFRNPVDYFETALIIARRIRIDNVMTMSLSSGQALIAGRIYRVNDFERVTIAGTTFFPILRCKKVNSRPNPQLLEIVFCRDRYLNPKSCSSRNMNDCSGQFEFPQVPA